MLSSGFDLRAFLGGCRSKIGKSKAHFRYQVEIPDVKLTGEYEIDTKLLFLELKGKGDFHINICKYTL